MSEETTGYDEGDILTQDEEDFLSQLSGLFGAPQPDEALWQRMEQVEPAVNGFINSVGFEGTGNTQGYDVHLSELQARWLLSAAGTFILRAVPDNQNGAADHLVDAAEAILAAVQAATV